MPGEQKMASVEPEATPSATTSLKDFGLELSSSDGGVVIADVDPNGKAADSGLQQGDLILDVGNKPVSNPGDVEKAVASARAEGLPAVLFRVKSGDRTRYVALTFAKS
jgi:serine protease Do